MKKLGIDPHKCGRYKQHQYIEDFFETIDTEEKAYWLGWMFSDGNVKVKSKGSRSYVMKLACCDKEVIDKFIASLHGTMKTQCYPRPDRGNPLYQIDLVSQKMVEDLIDKGCVPNKSLILKWPNKLPNHLIKHFIRGYFDGDGSVYITHHKWIKTRKTNPTICEYIRIGCSFIGTKEMMEEINKHVHFGTIYKEKRRSSNTWYIGTMGQKTCKDFYHYLYDDATIFLSRKKEKFEQYFNKDAQRL